ncbi:hypothetical protein DPV78_005112 [Talaromyces pinophilus]|nr:hypothetical protein DPV78_005112 [Talaromyces pinophilus]
MYRPRALLPAAVHLSLLIIIVNGHIDPRLAQPPPSCDLFLGTLDFCSVPYDGLNHVNSTQQSCLCKYTDHKQEYMFNDATSQCKTCLSTNSNDPDLCCYDTICPDCENCDINISEVDSWSGYCTSLTSIQPTSTRTQAAPVTLTASVTLIETETVISTSEAAASTRPNYAAEIAVGTIEGVLCLVLLGVAGFCWKKRRPRGLTARNGRDGHTSEPVR